MAMNSRQLEYFLAVAKELNFTKAAETMYVSQTAVTQQIKALEDQLGVNLFERTKRKVMLTPAGMVFQHEAQEILNRMDIAEQKTRQVSSGFTGALDIGFTVGIGNTDISERIQAFNQKYPNISLHFRNMSPSMLVKQLKNKTLDVALMPMFDKKYLEDLTFKSIAWDNLIAVLPYNHMLAQKQFLSWEDLKDERLILPSTSNSEVGEDKNIIGGFLRHGMEPNVIATIEDVETILFMISVNMGVTILPGYMAGPISTRGKLIFVPFGSVRDQVVIVAAWDGANDNPSLEKIVPFLEGEHPSDIEETKGPVVLERKRLL